MPNWAYTSVSVSGEEDQIQQFISTLTKGYYVPKGDPEQARENRVTLFEEGWTKVGTPSFGAFLDEIPKDYAVNWYDYNCKLFGVKWDCHSDNPVEYEPELGCWFHIETPWGFPKEGLELWVSKFPHLDFDFTTTEESDEFAVVAIGRKGKLYLRSFSHHELPKLTYLDGENEDEHWYEAHERQMESMSDLLDDAIIQLINSFDLIRRKDGSNA